MPTSISFSPVSELSNLSSNVGFGGLFEFESQGERRTSMTLSFDPFKVFKDVEISFNFDVNDEAPPPSFERAIVHGCVRGALPYHGGCSGALCS